MKSKEKRRSTGKRRSGREIPARAPGEREVQTQKGSEPEELGGVQQVRKKPRRKLK